MGLEKEGHRMVRTYSGGMIRRLEVAQFMLHRPPLLFLDEPTVDLDPLPWVSVWALVKQLCEDYGTTIVLTTHFLEEADNLHPLAIAGVILIVLLGSACFTISSLIIACVVKSRERFNGFGQLTTMPLFFASNAIYPLALMPPGCRCFLISIR